jgi:arylsulfatase A-like enzyme
LQQGFDVWKPFFVEKGRMENVATAETVVQNATAYLERLGEDTSRPFLLWMHINDLQANYIEHVDMPRFGDDPVDRYDHELRYVDTWFGSFMATLRRRADWGRTVVILTSDHGQAFGEHGYQNHGFGLHEHQLRVPLLIRVPGFQARPIATRVSQIDLAPTLFELAGVPESDPLRMRLDLRGQNVLYTLSGEERPPRPLHAELTAGPYNPEQQVWMEGDWKLHVLGRRQDLRLYNVSRDGEERHDLSIREREKAKALFDAMTTYRRRVLRVRPPWP